MAFVVEDLKRQIAELRAEAAAERKAREAAEAGAKAAASDAELQAKLRFFESMRGMATYASQRGVASRGSTSDHARVNLPPTAVVQDLVSTAFTTLQLHHVRSRWKAFKRFFSDWKPPQSADGPFERRNVHPVLNAMVKAALPPDSPWRAWFEVLVSDSLDAVRWNRT